MIDDEVAAQLFQAWRQFYKVSRRQHELDMPTQRPEALCVSL
jgi:hypothetical protein